MIRKGHFNRETIFFIPYALLVNVYIYPLFISSFDLDKNKVTQSIFGLLAVVTYGILRFLLILLIERMKTANRKD